MYGKLQQQQSSTLFSPEQSLLELLHGTKLLGSSSSVRFALRRSCHRHDCAMSGFGWRETAHLADDSHLALMLQ